MSVDGSEQFCVFCETRVRSGGEMHHFPTPKRLGGGLTVPTCRPCHDEADRLNLADWSSTRALVSILGVWSKASRDERIVLWKTHVVALEARNAIGMGKKDSLQLSIVGLEVCDAASS